MWKGYREAQCAWMQYPESFKKQKEQKSYSSCSESLLSNPHFLSNDISYGLYMVLYSPHRGFIEIWRARYGPKVLTLAVGANIRIKTVKIQ